MKLQGGCSFPSALPRCTIQAWANPPSSPNRESDSIEQWQGHPSRHSDRTCSAGRPRRENICSHLTTAVPSGISSPSTSSGHPGSQRTLSLLQPCYSWSSLSRDVTRYVWSCSVCAQSKTPRHLPVGKLVPLPIPQRPWSHIGIDFVTDLPNWKGNTCVFVTVDRFSKACKLVPLSGLPTALEAAEILFSHVFRNYRLPEDSLGLWSAIHLPSLESLLRIARGHGELVLRLPSPDEWPDWAHDPGARTIPPGMLPQGPTQLELLPPLGRVCTKLPSSELHRHHTLQVHA